MNNHGINESVDPFAKIDAERQEIEQLRREVAELRRLLNLCMDSTIVLLRDYNNRTTSS